MKEIILQREPLVFLSKAVRKIFEEMFAIDARTEKDYIETQRRVIVPFVELYHCLNSLFSHKQDCLRN